MRFIWDGYRSGDFAHLIIVDSAPCERTQVTYALIRLPAKREPVSRNSQTHDHWSKLR